ncbi:MAG: Methionyl-tRNA formyltransferase [Parcubacteria group bacterium GW2011_GWA2_44_12]|nr:MAG: Methionyl-tRNA formyltransferase [Parcubacteria group bacterium GW2011_GWA2_44_12]
MKNLIFWGTSIFAVPCLRALYELNELRPVLVITQPDRPKGRTQALEPSPVKIEAQKLGISILQPVQVKEILGEIQKCAPEVMVLVSYGQFIPKECISFAPCGIVNVHPSLLPKYRGASPIQSAILQGSAETGVSLMLLDEKLDHGPLIAQERILIKQEHDGITLSKELAMVAATLLSQKLPLYLAGQIQPVSQKHAEATYTARIRKEDGKLDFSKSAAALSRSVRAVFKQRKTALRSYWRGMSSPH